MIDHTKIKSGDEVQIAGGYYAKFICYVDYLKPNIKGAFKLAEIEHNGKRKLVSLDTITSHRPAFNWDDVKSGDCFELKEYGKGLYYYVCPAKDVLGGGDGTVFELHVGEMKGFVELKQGVLKRLTRHPEGDIKGE